MPGTVRGGCPDILLRRFDVYFAPRTKMAPLPMRGVRATHLGQLVRVRVSVGAACKGGELGVEVRGAGVGAGGGDGGGVRA